MFHHIDSGYMSDLLPQKRISIICGGFGAGKTEVAVNYAVHLAHENLKPCIVDLDIVNPYFRSREARDRMESAGVKVILPAEEFLHADLPIISPSIKGFLRSGERTGILDVGGDDVGARVLASFGDALVPEDNNLLLVINTRRPFLDSVEGCMRVAEEISHVTGLEPGGLISNTHLMNETTHDMILDGLDVAVETGENMHVPVVFLSVLAEHADGVRGRTGDIPILEMERLMFPPWSPAFKGPKLGKENFKL